MKYSLNDIFVVPSAISYVDTRNECNPFYTDGMLPLFTAPMSSVVDLSNYELFKNNKIESIIPRSVDFKVRKELCKKTWCAFSLNEFEQISRPSNIRDVEHMYIVIDIANGHMERLHKSIREVKSRSGNKIIIMAGNIANPKTYKTLSDAGADYIRVGIGTGSCCITSSNTAIHYPLASLISECYEISKNTSNRAKIVADGGIRGFADIIKALGLGADYVMCGSIFNRMLESAGDTYDMDIKINQYDEYVKELVKSGRFLSKEHYGMSTKRAQIEISGETKKTSEGIEIRQPVEYTMEQWVDNFISYLKSAMSYTSSFVLNDFIGNVETIIVSNNSYNAINK